MPLSLSEQLLSEQVGRIYADERDRILATLIGMLRDFDLAEEMMQEAFAAAILQWSESGIPEKPRAWIVSSARHKAIDRLRRDAAFRAKFPDLQREAEHAGEPENPLVFETEDTSQMIVCASSLPAATRRSLPRRRSPSLFVRSAASPPKKSRARFWCQPRPWRSAWSA